MQTDNSSGHQRKKDDQGIMVGKYRLEKTIGQGTYGKVKLAVDTTTSEKYAAKVLEKASIKSEKQVARIQREIRFLKLLHHPHIVKVYDVIETSELIYIFMELATGGELFDYIVTHKRLKEKEARFFYRQVLSAVDYCHQNAVIHRDLKPENLLLDSNKNIKIIDFGFGNTYKSDALLDTFCGSPFYAAPEMILGKRYEGPEVDLWSLGVILFALLCGHLPFDDENMKDLYKKISHGTYQIPDYVTEECRYLIGRMLTVDPRKRATLEEIKNSAWVCTGHDGPPKNYLPDRPLLQPSELDLGILKRMTAFGYKQEDVKVAFEEYNTQYIEAEKNFGQGNNEQIRKAVKMNPVTPTYFLLVEMLKREEQRIRVAKREVELVTQKSAPQLEMVRAITNSSKQNEGSLNSVRPLPPPVVASAIAKQEIAIPKPGDAAISISTGNLSPFVRPVDKSKSNKPNEGSREHSPLSNVKATSPHSLAGSVPANLHLVDPKEQTHQDEEVEENHEGTDSVSHLPSPHTSTRGSRRHSNQIDTPNRSQTHPNERRTSFVLGLQKAAASLLGTGKKEGSSSGSEKELDALNRHHARASTTGTPSVPTSPPTATRMEAELESHQVSSGPTNEIRHVNGWFMNVSTTSSKSPAELMQEVKTLLTDLENRNAGVRFEGDGNSIWVVNVEIVVNQFQAVAKELGVTQSTHQLAAVTNRHTQDKLDQEQNEDPLSESADDVYIEPPQTNVPASAMPTGRRVSGFVTASAHGYSNTGIVMFQIEVCKVPRLNLYGLHFKRLNGGVWNYKNVCSKLLSLMNL